MLVVIAYVSMAIVNGCETQECHTTSHESRISPPRRKRSLKQEKADIKDLSEYYQYKAYKEAMRDFERRRAHAQSITHR